MSMTPEQRQAAESALAQKQVDGMMKRIALDKRKRCIEDVSFFQLPYRVLYSLEQPPEQIPLTRFYPYRTVRAQTEQEVREAIARARESKGNLTEDEVSGIKRRIEAQDHTPKSDREYLFTCFLSGFDFDEFRDWDWTGNRLPEAEAERMKAHYKERQHDFEQHPEKYAAPVLKCNDDMNRYSAKIQELLKSYDKLF